MKITGKTRLLGFFADPAEHSKSPIMYNSVFEALNLDMVYLAFTTPKEDIGKAMEAMRTLNMRGANISMPNKAAVMDYLDEISNEARLVGAVNTVVNSEGRLIGYNTDIYGAVKALQVMGADLKGAKVVLLGAGGAGSAIMAGLASEGATEIAVFVREKSIEKHREFSSKIQKHTGTEISLYPLEDRDLLTAKIREGQILINGTNVGMGTLKGETLVEDSGAFHRDLFVMDAIYSPAETKLLSDAKAAGVRGCCNGLNMLLYQGEKAFKLYTGEDMPLDIVKKVIED